MAYIEELLTNISITLKSIAPTIALILITAGGIMLGIANIQPAESRGKMISWATGLIIAGIIVGAISAGSDIILNSSQNLLK